MDRPLVSSEHMEFGGAGRELALATPAKIPIDDECRELVLRLVEQPGGNGTIIVREGARIVTRIGGFGLNTALAFPLRFRVPGHSLRNWTIEASTDCTLWCEGY